MGNSMKFVFLLTFVLISLPDYCLSRVIRREIGNERLTQLVKQIEARHQQYNKGNDKPGSKEWRKQTETTSGKNGKHGFSGKGGKHGWPSEHGKHDSTGGKPGPFDGGKHQWSGEGGKHQWSGDGGKHQWSGEGGKHQWSGEGGKHQWSGEGGKHQWSGEGGKHHSSSESSSEGSKHHSSSESSDEGGKHHSSSESSEEDHLEIVKDFSEILRHPKDNAISKIEQLLTKISSTRGTQGVKILVDVLTNANMNGFLSLRSGGKTIAQWFNLANPNVNLLDLLVRLFGANGTLAVGIKPRSGHVGRPDIPKLIYYITGIIRGNVEVRLYDLLTAIGFKGLPSGLKVPNLSFKGLDVHKLLQIVYNSLNLPKIVDALFRSVLPNPGVILDALRALESLGTGHYNWFQKGSGYDDVIKVVKGFQSLANLTVLGQIGHSFGVNLDHWFRGLHSSLKDLSRVLVTSVGVLTGNVSVPALLHSLGINSSVLFSLPKGSTPQSFTLDHLVQFWSKGDFNVLELLNRVTSPTRGLQNFLNALRELWTTGHSDLTDDLKTSALDLQLPGSGQQGLDLWRILPHISGGSGVIRILEHLLKVVQSEDLKLVIRDWIAVTKGELQVTVFLQKYLGPSWRVILGIPDNSNPNDLNFQTVLKFALNVNSTAILARFTNAVQPALKGLIGQLEKLVRGELTIGNFYNGSLNPDFFVRHLNGSDVHGLDLATVVKSFAQIGVDVDAILKTMTSSSAELSKLTKFLDRILSNNSNLDTLFDESGVPSLRKVIQLVVNSRLDKIDIENVIRFLFTGASLHEFLARLTSPDSPELESLLDTLRKLFEGEIGLRDALKRSGLPEDVVNWHLPGSQGSLSELWNVVRILLSGHLHLVDVLKNSPSANRPEVHQVFLDITAFLEGRITLEVLLKKYDLENLFKILQISSDLRDIKAKVLIEYLSGTFWKLPKLLANLSSPNPGIEWLQTELEGILSGKITSENAFNGSLLPTLVADLINNSSVSNLNISEVLFQIFGKNYSKILIRIITTLDSGVDGFRVALDTLTAFLKGDLSIEAVLQKLGIPNPWEILPLPKGSNPQDFTLDSLIRVLVTRSSSILAIIKNLRSPSPGLQKLFIIIDRFLSGKIDSGDLLVDIGVPDDVVGDSHLSSSKLTIEAILNLARVISRPDFDLLQILKRFKSSDGKLDDLRIKVIALLEGKITIKDLLKEVGLADVLPNGSNTDRLNVTAIVKGLLDVKSDIERTILDKSSQALPWLKKFIEDLKGVLNGSLDIQVLQRHSIPEFPKLPVNVTKFLQQVLGSDFNITELLAKVPSSLTVIVKIGELIEGLVTRRTTWNNAFENSGIPSLSDILTFPPWSNPTNLTLENAIRFVLDGELKGAIQVLLSKVTSKGPELEVLLGNLKALFHNDITLKEFLERVGFSELPQLQLLGSHLPKFDWDGLFRVVSQLGTNFTKLIMSATSEQPELQDLLDNCMQLLEGKITITVWFQRVFKTPKILEILHINKNSSLTVNSFVDFLSTADFSAISNLFVNMSSLSPGVKNIVQILIQILENKITIEEGFQKSGLVIRTVKPPHLCRKTQSKSTEDEATPNSWDTSEVRRRCVDSA